MGQKEAVPGGDSLHFSFLYCHPLPFIHISGAELRAELPALTQKQWVLWVSALLRGISRAKKDNELQPPPADNEVGQGGGNPSSAFAKVIAVSPAEN